jgi:hypothetical protein
MVLGCLKKKCFNFFYRHDRPRPSNVFTGVFGRSRPFPDLHCIGLMGFRENYQEWKIMKLFYRFFMNIIDVWLQNCEMFFLMKFLSGL